MRQESIKRRSIEEQTMTPEIFFGDYFRLPMYRCPFFHGIFFIRIQSIQKKEAFTMAFTHYQQIRDQELPSMEIDNVKAFLKDFSDSRQVSHSNTPIPIMK